MEPIAIPDPMPYRHCNPRTPTIPMTKIDTLIPVPVRKLWRNEAADFTPWLLDNAALLGEVLGTELFPEGRERRVGRYSADLMFRDSSDRLVVVENMFGATDHDHLGKLITYSAGLDAGIAVLVAEEFRDEHRSALDWLNRISLNDFAFFGVVLEAWRIGDSDPAPRLRVDTKPDDWSRTVRSAGDSERAQTYRRFWGEFLPRLHEAHPDWSRVRTPSKDHWMSFGSARSDLYRYNPAFGAALRGTCRVELYVDSPTITPSDVFDWLFERREKIEAEVPQEIDWDRLDGNRACRIAVYFRDEVRVTEEHRWPELIDWFVETLGQLKAAFDPVIRDYPRDAGT